jgi:hypothetical protein
MTHPMTPPASVPQPLRKDARVLCVDDDPSVLAITKATL